MIKHVAKRIDLIAALPHGSIMAEIGCCKGWFASDMLNLPNLGMLYLIDSWKSRPEYNDPLSSADHEQNYQDMLHNLSGHINNPNCRVKIFRCDSTEAHKFFDRQPQLDAVYIDADHSYEAVSTDLRYWSRFMKPNGWIMGHDFCDQHPMAIKYGWGVERAVKQFCEESDWKLTAITDEDFPSFCLRQ